MLGESVHPAVHHSVTVSKVTLHSFEQGRGLGSGIRTPSSQEGDSGVEKSVFICEICGTMLKKTEIPWQFQIFPLYLQHVRYYILEL